MAVEMVRHERSSSALRRRALLPQAVHLPRVIHLVILQDSELHFLLLMFDLLGLGVGFFLPLLRPSSKSKHQVKGGLLLNIVIRKGSSILKLLAGKNKTLLIGRDPLLILDLSLHVVYGIRRLHLEGDSLPSNCKTKTDGEKNVSFPKPSSQNNQPDDDDQKEDERVLTGLHEDLHVERLHNFAPQRTLAPDSSFFAACSVCRSSAFLSTTSSSPPPTPATRGPQENDMRLRMCSQL